MGPYRVTALIAQGGMACVYDAEHTSTGQHVAIKVLRSLTNSEESRQRFRREFRHLGRIQHPHVLRVYESGLHNGRPWYSMERIEGKSLKESLSGLSQTPSDERFLWVERLLRQCADALAAIHEKGLVHRDIKPSNILLTQAGDIKLTDFGVIKVLALEQSLTAELVGTMEYMAPEQIQRDEMDGRTDLYTLGLVLYELLTGERPYRAHTARGYIEQHLRATVKPPVEIDSNVPMHLNAICMRLLQKRPADRYASANHLLQMLGEHPSHDSLDVERWPPRAVGRTAQRATLEHLIEHLHSDSVGSALLIKGTTGQGKTSLLDAGAEFARTHGVTVARARAPQGGGTFSMFEQVYRALPTHDPDPRLVNVFDQGVLPVDRYAFYGAFHELLRAHGALLLILDDLQFCDAPSIEFLLYLVHNALHLGSDPFVFVLSQTIGGAPLHDDLANSPDLRVLELKPLTAPEVEELILTLLTDNEDSRRLAAWLHEESGGAPAFVLDMLRAMLTEGRLEPNEGKYRLKQRDDGALGREELPLPPSLRQVLQDRIKPLSEKAHTVGSILALSRQGIPFDVLLAVAPLEESGLLSALDELEDDEIVEHIRTADEDRFQLSHKRFRDVLLARVEAAEIRRLHRSIGENLERYHRHRIDAISEDLASHFRLAGLPNKAYLYLTRTAGMYLRGSLYEQATKLFDRALTLEPEARRWMLLDEADDRLTRVYIARGRAMFHHGQLEKALSDLRRAQALATDLGNAKLQSKAARHLGTLLRNVGRHQEEAETHLRNAIRWAEEAGDETLLADPVYQLGGVLWGQGDLDGAERCWRRALDIATRMKDLRSQGLGWNGLGILALCRGRALEARRNIERSATIFEELGMLDRLVISRVNLIELYLQMGLLKKALTLADRTIRRAEEVQHPHGVALARAWRAQSLRALLRYDEALAEAQAALTIVQSLEAHEDEVLCLLTILQTHLSMKNYAVALATADTLNPLLERYDHEGVGPQVVILRAMALAGLGDRTGGEKLLKDNPLDTLEGGWPHIRTRRALALGVTLRALNRLDESRAVLLRALALAEGNGFRYPQLQIHHELALVAEDNITAERHQRVARALSQSLTANLSNAEAEAIRAFSWGVFEEKLPGDRA